MFNLTTRTLTAAAVIVAATAPSAAYARIAHDPQAPIGGGQAQEAIAPFVSGQQASPARGFHWGDAAIGAAGMLVLLCTGATLALIARRRGSGRRLGSRLALSALLLLALFAIGATSAWAEASSTICVPEAAEKPVLSGSAGKCKAKYKTVALPGSGGLATLNKVLPHMSYSESGVGGKPTIQFAGVNVQVVNGEGKTASANGAGNLVLGYDENAGAHSQSGSHDLILGSEQTFTSFAGIDAGKFNTISGEYASVTGGFSNTAGGPYDSISGGAENRETGALSFASSISGGAKNSSIGARTWVGGGEKNAASGEQSAVSGGLENEATFTDASVSGGFKNQASALYASVSGGAGNHAIGFASWVGGGATNTARGVGSSVSAGEENEANGKKASVNGGKKNKAEGNWSSILGGFEHTNSTEFGTTP